MLSHHISSINLKQFAIPNIKQQFWLIFDIRVYFLKHIDIFMWFKSWIRLIYKYE